MTSPNKLDDIRNETLVSMDRNELYFKVLVVFSGVLELAGLITLVLVIDWSNRTHIVVFVAALLVYMTLGVWVWALAHRNRVGEQRILRAIELLEGAVRSQRDEPAE